MSNAAKLSQEFEHLMTVMDFTPEQKEKARKEFPARLSNLGKPPPANSATDFDLEEAMRAVGLSEDQKVLAREGWKKRKGTVVQGAVTIPVMPADSR